MISRLPWLLLTLSVLFNIFFAGGYLQAESRRKVASTGQGAAEEAADRLGLDAAQREAFFELARAQHEQASQFRREVIAARRQFWADLAGREPDSQELASLQELDAQQRFQHRLMMGQRLRQFMDLLTPEQRRKVAEMVSRRLEGTTEGRRWTQTWDSDKDGRISDTERAAARGALRRRMMGPRNGRGPGGPGGGDVMRDMMLRRFDADGDGVLNAEERSQAFEAVLNWQDARGPASRPR